MIPYLKVNTQRLPGWMHVENWKHKPVKHFKWQQ
uniref:Uncharacterized protein n=1 Tax=Anguilla anguilla TaxID=7936 RepID=A0A0E9VWA0_ANGAN